MDKLLFFVFCVFVFLWEIEVIFFTKTGFIFIFLWFNIRFCTDRLYSFSKKIPVSGFHSLVNEDSAGFQPAESLLFS